MAVIRKTIVYFATVFAIAFVFGVIRTSFVAPRIGAAAAVAIEVPIILCASWLSIRRLLRDRPYSLGQRSAIGVLAFSLLIISEATLSVAMRGESIPLWAASLFTPVGLLGLSAQIGFALMPILVGHVRAPRADLTS